MQARRNPLQLPAAIRGFCLSGDRDRATFDDVALLKFITFHEVIPRIPLGHEAFLACGSSSGIGRPRPTNSTSASTTPEGRVGGVSIQKSQSSNSGTSLSISVTLLFGLVCGPLDDEGDIGLSHRKWVRRIGKVICSWETPNSTSGFSVCRQISTSYPFKRYRYSPAFRTSSTPSSSRFAKDFDINRGGVTVAEVDLLADGGGDL